MEQERLAHYPDALGASTGNRYVTITRARRACLYAWVAGFMGGAAIVLAIVLIGR